MLEAALKSFAIFFATIGPVETAVLFATLTPKMPRRERAGIALRATARIRSSVATLASSVVTMT